MIALVYYGLRLARGLFHGARWGVSQAARPLDRLTIALLGRARG